MTPPLDPVPEAAGFIARTVPPMPEDVREALGFRPGKGGDEAASSVDPETVVRELAAGALRRMDGVLGHPGGGRELAFELLAADALLTWACEAAADATRPDDMLREVVSTLTAPAP